jgi:hypothetical protein
MSTQSTISTAAATTARPTDRGTPGVPATNRACASPMHQASCVQLARPSSVSTVQRWSQASVGARFGVLGAVGLALLLQRVRRASIRWHGRRRPVGTSRRNRPPADLPGAAVARRVQSGAVGAPDHLVSRGGLAPQCRNHAGDGLGLAAAATAPAPGAVVPRCTCCRSRASVASPPMSLPCASGCSRHVSTATLT